MAAADGRRPGRPVQLHLAREHAGLPARQCGPHPPQVAGLESGRSGQYVPGESGPGAKDVAAIEPNHAVILGNQGEDGTWISTWQFVLNPVGEGTTLLIVRSRTTQTGGIWDVLHPGIFIMERGMLIGIKERAEKTSPP